MLTKSVRRGEQNDRKKRKKALSFPHVFSGNLRQCPRNNQLPLPLGNGFGKEKATSF